MKSTLHKKNHSSPRVYAVSVSIQAVSSAIPGAPKSHGHTTPANKDPPRFLPESLHRIMNFTQSRILLTSSLFPWILGCILTHPADLASFNQLSQCSLAPPALGRSKASELRGRFSHPGILDGIDSLHLDLKPNILFLFCP